MYSFHISNNLDYFKILNLSLCGMPHQRLDQYRVNNLWQYGWKQSLLSALRRSPNKLYVPKSLQKRRWSYLWYGEWWKSGLDKSLTVVVNLQFDKSSCVSSLQKEIDIEMQRNWGFHLTRPTAWKEMLRRLLM